MTQGPAEGLFVRAYSIAAIHTQKARDVLQEPRKRRTASSACARRRDFENQELPGLLPAATPPRPSSGNGRCARISSTPDLRSSRWSVGIGRSICGAHTVHGPFLAAPSVERVSSRNSSKASTPQGRAPAAVLPELPPSRTSSPMSNGEAPARGAMAPAPASSSSAPAPAFRSAGPPQVMAPATMPPRDNFHKAKQAIARARKAGADDAKLKSLERMLTQEQAAEALDQAIQCADIQALRHAISRAQHTGVERKFVDAARAHLQQLEAYEMLSKALEAGCPEALQAAIFRAKKVGVPQEDIASIEKVKLDIEVRSMLKAAMSTRQIEAIRYAIREAKELKEEEPMIEEATKLVDKLVAQKTLSLAMSGKDRSALRDAVNKARDAGVEDTEVQRAAKLLTQQDALENLKAAIRGCTPQGLREAIIKAQSAGVDRREVEKAERFLAQQDEASAPPNRRHSAAVTLSAAEAPPGRGRRSSAA